jgi:hypothetical protein
MSISPRTAGGAQKKNNTEILEQLQARCHGTLSRLKKSGVAP